MSGYHSVTSASTGAAFSIRPSVMRQVIDFANVFKAFIGTNWIALPFAFQQSGLVVGCVCLVIIATLTDHCCQMIIVCKKAAVRKVLHSMPQYNNPETTDSERHDIEDTLERKIMYGDIGRISMGKSGTVLVEISLFVTQFSFCVAYFIFIGNTVMNMFPKRMPPISNTTLENSTSNYTVVEPFPVSTAPIFPLLVLIPVVPLILMSFIRRVRKLGPVSFIANLALLFAFLAVLGYMLSEWKFKVNEMKLANWATFPVFFGQLTGAYEGIGTLVPIESSMGENRHRYPMYLHLAIGILSLIFGGFGIAGYLKYGDNVSQIVTQMLPPGPLVYTIQILICFAVLFTYPLQLFPVTEIVEKYLFKSYNKRREEKYGDTKFAREVKTVQDSGIMTDTTEAETDVDETTELMSAAGENGTTKPKKRKSSWRKNFIRTILVLVTAGVAIFLKDDFAYVGALCGSVGSTMLAYVLPCIFHMRLLKDKNSRLVVAKNIFLIVFGVVGGGVGLSVTIKQIIDNFSK